MAVKRTKVEYCEYGFPSAWLPGLKTVGRPSEAAYRSAIEYMQQWHLRNVGPFEAEVIASEEGYAAEMGRELAR